MQKKDKRDEYSLANFCPVKNNLAMTYQLGDLNQHVAELLLKNSVMPSQDENFLRSWDDVKAINPLFLKRKLQEFDKITPAHGKSAIDEQK